MLPVPYSPAFRAEAVRRARRSGQSINEVAAALSVHPSTLRKWLVTHPVSVEADEPVEEAARPAAPVQALLVSDRRVITEVDGPAGWVDEPSARRRPRLVAYLAVAELLALSVALSAVIHPSRGVYTAGVVVHLLSLIAGFGAVMLVDWHGLLWLIGRRQLAEVGRLAEAANPLIWTAMIGLLASAAVLKPNLASEMTWVKIVAVLLICLNGVWLSALGRVLSARPSYTPQSMPTSLRRRLVTATVASHLGWWTAIAIGLVTNLHRS